MKDTTSLDLLFAKINDKIKFCNTKNKITHTDFFTEPEIIKIEKYLKKIKINNYFFFGGNPDANRKMLFFYPDKLTLEIAMNNINSILNIIQITIPQHQIFEFEHRVYLSAIMKLGIIREKFGDIIVHNEGADIIVQKENSEYFKENLKLLTRFKKARIQILDISQIHKSTQTLKELSIIVSSMRIDNFVSEITHCSRNKAEEFIELEKVMINYKIINKNSKIVNIHDIITIRGFGKYVVKEISKTTKNNKLIVILVHNK